MFAIVIIVLSIFKSRGMISMTSIYIVLTAGLFIYTVSEQMKLSHGYFAASLAYMSNQVNAFIIYNAVLSMAIIFYQLCVSIFLERTLEGQVMKIIDRLKIKLLDVVFFSYIIDLKFDFQVYLVLVLLIFLFILHIHISMRSQYLVHVHTTSTSLRLHYRVLALFFVLFFFDYQVLKFAGAKILSINDQSEALFLYYMFSTAMVLAEPFLQFVIDFYEKYTFTHFKNSDQFLAVAGLIINIPRLTFQLLISIWITYKFSQPLFILISGIDNISQLKKTIDSFYRIRKLTTAMTFLKKVKGEQLQNFHDLTCTVCYEDMKDAVMLPCKHIFHEECIRQWIIKNLNHFCPKCKKQFNFDKIGEEYQQQQPVVAARQNQQQQFRNLSNFINNKKKEENQGHLLDRQKLIRRDDYEEQQMYQEHEVQKQFPSANRKFKPQRLINENKLVNRQQGSTYLQQADQLYPLQFQEKSKKLAVGSLPFSLPTAAVPHRTVQHMKMRKYYENQNEVILRLMSMSYNDQMLLL